MSPSNIQWPQDIEWCYSKSSIRDKFNQCQFYERLSDGELSATIFKSRHQKPESEPYCTHSQILVYWDSSQQPVAMVHQYLRPDGTIGASGKPDPKWIIIENKVIVLKTSPPR
jgi:hypothetical protein